MVAALRDAASAIDLTGLITSWRQAKIGTNVGRMSEANGVIGGNDQGQGSQGTNTWNGHHSPDSLVAFFHGQELSIKLLNLLGQT